MKIAHTNMLKSQMLKLKNTTSLIKIQMTTTIKRKKIIDRKRMKVTLLVKMAPNGVKKHYQHHALLNITWSTSQERNQDQQDMYTTPIQQCVQS